MKSVLLIALAVLVCALPAVAQDRIELYADANMSTCSISEPVSPPIVQVHVFVKGPVPVTAVRFVAAKPDCWVGATWLGDAIQPTYIAAGTSQNDWSVAFGRCLDATNGAYIGAISYLIAQQALPCCVVNALPTELFHLLLFVDCPPTWAEIPLEPSKPLIVNPNETCGCQSGSTLAVEPSTWGRVKSLYR